MDFKELGYYLFMDEQEKQEEEEEEREQREQLENDKHVKPFSNFKLERGTPITSRKRTRKF